MKIYTMLISHRHGDDVTVHRSDEAATSALAKYCRQWWSHEGLEGEPPVDDESVIERYWEHIQDESVSIEAHDLAADAESEMG